MIFVSPIFTISDFSDRLLQRGVGQKKRISANRFNGLVEQSR